jgi:hypothetical protein
MTGCLMLWDIRGLADGMYLVRAIIDDQLEGQEESGIIPLKPKG